MSGRAVDRPVLKQGKNKRFCTFTIAVRRPYVQGKISKEMKTDFFDCIAWGRQADNLRRHLPKGGLVLIQGNLETFKAQAQDGHTYKKHIISVFQSDIIHWRRDDGSSTVRPRLEDIEIDDVPTELQGMLSEHGANKRRKQYENDIPKLENEVNGSDPDMPTELFFDFDYDDMLSDLIPYNEELYHKENEDE